MADKESPNKGKPSKNKGVKKPLYVLYGTNIADDGTVSPDIKAVTRRSDVALGLLDGDKSLKYTKVMLDEAK